MRKSSDNYFALLHSIAETAEQEGRSLKEIVLVAVTKNQTVEEVQGLYDAGCRVFGENRVQEALPKIAALPSDCVWHMIGTLQKNKARKAVEVFSMIESVDTPELAMKLSEAALQLNTSVPLLLQVNTSGETSKHGLEADAWKQAYETVRNLPGVRILGLMTMAPYIQDKTFIRHCFARLRKLRDELPGIGPHLSMGMSHDYREAIAEGATILRIGSLLFP